METRELDGRLSAIAGMVPNTGLVVDVGSDHGLLIAHLVESGRVTRGIATDINPQPLEKTRLLLARKGLEDWVDLYLTDGLGGVPPDGVGAVVIAGMGGELIHEIITAWPHHKNPDIRWVLQPMTKAHRLRRGLWEAGFAILEERCCHAAGRGYTAMEAVYKGAPQPFLPWQPYVGGLLPRTAEDHIFLAAYRDRLLAVAAARERVAATPETESLKEAARQLSLLLDRPML